jgi:dienelactone hydrolase
MKRLMLLLACSASIHAATLPRPWQITNSSLVAYFSREVRDVSGRSDACLNGIGTADEWRARVPEMRAQLAEMLGLAPLPARTDLKATVTKRFEDDAFTVENLHFQSLPGLYVTANLYVPKNLSKPAPTVLYVCGHGPFVTNGISYGTKVSYQHWGSWFARNGYVCLIIDTLESGEILGNHHGTYRDGLWWWISRGYTPAGVECWNGMRALDYLATRKEVDMNRVGVTGRSGGGAYSWFITAMDDRIRCAAPTAGITDLENHVIDGAVEGHCDCMFFVNTYRWDYAQLAALAAPRPLLLCNTDDDNIFPLDGVVRVRNKVRRVYDLLGKGTNFGLVITPGPHKDTQELQVPVMRWFNRYLKGEEPLIETAATKLFTPQQLKVFDKLPADSINTNIDFSFVPAKQNAAPGSKEEWNEQKAAWIRELCEKSFASWPQDSAPASLNKYASDASGDWKRDYFEVESEPGVKARLALDLARNEPADRMVVRVTNMLGDPDFHSRAAMAQLETRGAGEKAYADLKKRTQIRRRFMLLGETVDSMRVWDIVRAIEAIHASKEFGRLPIRIEAEGDMAVNVLYASLFAPVDELVLSHLPQSHMNGPAYLNVLRILDIPQAVAMASERCRVELRAANAADWKFVTDTARLVGFEKNLRIMN